MHTSPTKNQSTGTGATIDNKRTLNGRGGAKQEEKEGRKGKERDEEIDEDNMTTVLQSRRDQTSFPDLTQDPFTQFLSLSQEP